MLANRKCGIGWLMAAPSLDIDREAVRVLVIAVGAREAARQMGLSENTVLAWSNRYGWLEQAREAQALAAQSQDGPKRPTQSFAIKAGEALANTLARRKESTKLSLSRFVQRASAKAATLPSSQLLAQAQDVKAVALTAAQVWPEQNTPQAHVISVNLLGLTLEKPVAGQIVELE